jgi:hypothetical protein
MGASGFLRRAEDLPDQRGVVGHLIHVLLPHADADDICFLDLFEGVLQSFSDFGLRAAFAVGAENLFRNIHPICLRG